MKILEEAVFKLAEDPDGLHQAVFMIDAAVYLDDKNWEKIERIGIFHREALVRKLVKAVARDRKNNYLAESYSNELLRSKDLLDTWLLGQAISEIGNEETVSKIYRNLPPEVYIRSYLIDLTKTIEKSLEKSRYDEDKKFVLSPVY